MADKRKTGFLPFFLEWAELKRWEVPEIHLIACDWLEHRGDVAVLRCFRGFGKSTLLACYNAWRYWHNPLYRILHQGDQDKTAFKTSRDTKNVLMRHPWTKEWAKGIKGESSFWWCPEADDERNPSMQAAGITSNITSSRCDEAQNDDVEVPRNITKPEMREKMRYRLGEQTHCLVPGGCQLYVGTPHTHDSIYDELEQAGADCLTIKMFDREHRIEEADKLVYLLPFAPDMVFFGIGNRTRELLPGVDFDLDGLRLTFRKAPGGLVDFYAGSAWPSRFTPVEMLKRRKKTRTINEWDSQYQLHSKPVHNVRLNPDRMIPYDVEPTFGAANGEFVMRLGKARIVSASVRWDPSGAKLKSDVSALAVFLQDDFGRLYWHRALALTGEVAELDDDGKIIGGQVWQICDVVEGLRLPRVTIEDNGVGAHTPNLLRGAMKARRIINCGVKAVTSTLNKQKKILGAFQAPLSGGYLWAHVSVIETVHDMMRDWIPSETDQPDDHLDAGATAILDEPVRVGGQSSKNSNGTPREDWRPSAGVFEVETTN